MYTKILRMIVKMKKQMAGHCDGDGDSNGGSGGCGHCS